MTTLNASLRLAKQTKGALRYDEVDPKSGAPIQMTNSVIGTLYLRKSNFPDGEYPNAIKVEVFPVS